MEEKDKKEEKKEEEKERKTINIEDVNPEDIERLIEALSGSGGKEINKKVKIIGISNKVTNNIFLDIIYYILINTLIILAFDGFFKVFAYSNFLMVVLFIVIFSILEFILRTFIFEKYPSIYIYSMGLITPGIGAISAFIPLILFTNFKLIRVDEVYIFVFMLLILFIVRSFITGYVRSKLIRNRIIKKRIK